MTPMARHTAMTRLATFQLTDAREFILLSVLWTSKMYTRKYVCSGDTVPSGLRVEVDC